MRNYINNLKANNKKGFSLVELIIVIAIMAILVGIVASQVIPYMEKSRKGKDQQQLSSVTTAGVSTIADHKTAITKIDKMFLSTTTAQAANNVDDEFFNNLASLLSDDGEGSKADLADIASKMEGKFKSKAFKDTKVAYVYDSGTFTTYASKSTLQNVTDVTDEKMKAISE